MAYDLRRVPPLRPTALLIVAVAVHLAGVALFGVTLAGQRVSPLVVWLPTLAGIASTCWATGTRRATTSPGRCPRPRSASG